MKKTLALLLALAMCLALAACGSKTSTTDTPSKSPDTTAPASSDSGGEVVYDEVKLISAVSDNETSQSGEQIKYFIDYLEEKSGGKVTVEVYWGGSFATDAEVPTYLEQGNLDISFSPPSAFYSVFPFIASIPSLVSNDDDLRILNALIDDPDSGAIIQAQGAKHNMILLAHNTSGSNLLLFKNAEVKGWAEASKYKVGLGFGAETFASFGMGTVTIEPPDLYDSISRGVCDAVTMSDAGVVGLKLNEVAKNVLDLRFYMPGVTITMNLDKFNSLNEATQNLIKEASRAWAQKSLDDCNATYDALKASILADGGTWNQLSDADAADYYYKSQAETISILYASAKNLGDEADFAKLIEKWNELTGVEFNVDGTRK